MAFARENFKRTLHIVGLLQRNGVSLLAGTDAPGFGAGRSRLGLPPEVITADAASYLEHCATGSFDGFSLSNILDGADPAYARRLWAAVRRAAAPGAVSILRSFSEPADPAEAEGAARDRSALWGAVRVEVWP